MKRLLFLIAAVLGFVAVAFAQEGVPVDPLPVPDPLTPDATLQDFLGLYDALYIAIVNILGYLHNWIPGLNMINAKWIRVVLIGLVVAVIFTLLGLTNGLGTVLLFLQAVGFYEIILKKAVPSPSVTKKDKA